MTLIGEWKGGHDPSREKAGELPTLQAVLDRYIAVRKLKASTAADYQQLLDTHLSTMEAPADRLDCAWRRQAAARRHR